MKYNLCLCLIIINIIYSYIQLPFKTFKVDNINNLYYNYLYINLDVGVPKQNATKLFLTQGKHSFYIYDSKSYSNVSYNPGYSSGYRAILDDPVELTTSDCYKGVFSMDTFFIQNQKFDNFTFILCTRSKSNIYQLFDGEIGLNLEYAPSPNSNFIQVLKNKEIIDNYIYSINYVNDEEGFLLIGEYPHMIYSNNFFYQKTSEFNEENLKWIHSEIGKYNYHWTILFDKISYGDGGFFQAQREARIVIDTKYIISSSQYYNLFKEIFGQKCTVILLGEDLQGLKCSKDINIELTPEIKFFNKELNTTFVLDYNDLFIEKDDYFYFLVINYIEYEPNYWILGKPFLKKYLLLYNYDNKMIGFYNNERKNKNNRKNLLSSYGLSIFFNIFFAFIVIVLLFVFFRYYFKNRRIRANELEDKFNYKAKNDK